ncbi:MAU2 chromatid cohesion factor -like protein [Collichthys lucidus]|uniref:Cohesin loading complex subunit SCC4 homolog n=1 Tax=Collichthys lucidus TaxID=240159 RepID=A0A4U5UXE9_COLLU|nr:MAU2 chromatid cohesion factor -like protein [Collichthys lucidus]
MAGSTDALEPWCRVLLGFAEHFRTSSPPKIRLCVHCLQAVFQFKPPPRVEARTHLQLGSVLYRHTREQRAGTDSPGDSATTRTGEGLGICL